MFNKVGDDDDDEPDVFLNFIDRIPKGPVIIYLEGERGEGEGKIF